MTAIAPALQAFFTDRLITQRNASPETIAAYRDTFRLLLRFAHDQTGKQPFELDIDDLDAPLVGAFLSHLERDRGNSPRTRNARLGAIHSFYRFAAFEHPEHAHTIARVMAIPTKRHQRSTVSYLDLSEIKALLAAPDRGTWLGRRDRALLALMIQTGVRVSELTRLHVGDVHLGTGRHIRVEGKGRKRRATPLTGETVALLRQWLAERAGAPEDPLFPTRQGRALSRYTVGLLISKYTDAALVGCPSLMAKRVTPLSRPGARFRCCHRPVSPGRSPNPPYQSLGNGLSTVAGVRRGSQVAMGMGSCCPGRRNGRPSRFRSGRTRPRPPRYATSRSGW